MAISEESLKIYRKTLKSLSVIRMRKQNDVIADLFPLIYPPPVPQVNNFNWLLPTCGTLFERS